jgi:hypothetical protein
MLEPWESREGGIVPMRYPFVDQDVRHRARSTQFDVGARVMMDNS